MRELQKQSLPGSPFVLDRTSFIPLWQQIKRWLLNEMERGRWSNGEPLPSETQIAEHCGVSRMTARQAMNELRIEGRIQRERGRGSFLMSEPSKDSP